MQQATSNSFAPVRIEKDCGALTIAGFGERFDGPGAAGIPALWQRLGQVPGQAGDDAYGVISDVQFDPFSFAYLAGVEVTDTGDLPEGFSTVRVAAGNYAVFEHSGHVSTLPASCDAIWSQGLPQAGLKAVEGGAWFEKYSESFDPQTGLGVIEIWIAVQ